MGRSTCKDATIITASKTADRRLVKNNVRSVLKDMRHYLYKDRHLESNALNIVKFRNSSNKLQLELQHSNVEKARSVKEDISQTQSLQTDSSGYCLSMDLKQILTVPSFSYSEMFYLRQLSSFSFRTRSKDMGQRTYYVL